MKQVYSSLRHKHKVKGRVIFTPPHVAYEAFGVVKETVEIEIERLEGKGVKPIIFDPCVGTGNFLEPFKKYFGGRVETVGVDVIDYEDRTYCDTFIHNSWLSISKTDIDFDRVVFTCIFPPFSDFQDLPKFGGSLWRVNVNLNNKTNGFLPEIFLQKLIDCTVSPKAILICSMGFRLNQRSTSRRRKQFMMDFNNKITGVISYPLNVFPEVSFHVEGLIWNLEGIAPHTWGGQFDRYGKLL